MGIPRLPIQVRIINNETYTIGVDDHEMDVTKSLPAQGRQQASHVHEHCDHNRDNITL